MPDRRACRRLVAPLLVLLAGIVAMPSVSRCQERIALTLDTAQAAAVLALLEHGGTGVAASDPRWQRLFASEGHGRLKDREAGMGRPFADSTFVAFVRSDTLRARRAALRRTLDAWSRASVVGAANRALAYLPDEARIRATIYLVIKPRTNSFVWDVDRNPAIFLYVDPTVTTSQFENTVAHELHHIGFASVQAATDSLRASIPDSARHVAIRLGAFAEGFAMLAAAGGPQVHPHAASAAADRARWDRDVARFDDDLRALERFFLDALAGRIAKDSVGTVAATFYGVQGPWYTVGWTMGVTIERAFGRAELIRCMRDPRRALGRYNDAVRLGPVGAGATWSPSLIAAFGIAPGT
jgi:hypothetical protein